MAVVQQCAARVIGTLPAHARHRIGRRLERGRLAGWWRVPGLCRVLTADDPDATVETELCGSVLTLPRSHMLPTYRRQHPSYSENLGLVARLVAAGGGDTAIDVGANVGDSVAILKAYAPGMRILCVDADVTYLPFLRANTAAWDDVEIAVPVLLAEAPGVMEVTLSGGCGTSQVVADPGTSVTTTSLDDLLDAHPRFRAPHLLKSDTDGFDDRVLRGASRTLAEARPVLFLEYDPHLLDRAGSDGLAMLARLRCHGYDRVAFYDKFGIRLVRGHLADEELLRDLHEYAAAGSIAGVDHFDLVVTTPAHGALVDALPVRADASTR